MGWVSVSVTSLPGMLDDIEIQVRKAASHIIDSGHSVEVASEGIPQVIDISLKKTAAVDNWRSRMENLLDALDSASTGVLITVDEIDPNLDETIELAAVYQHFVRDGRKVSLLMAGLPANVSALLNDETVSFLRRAQVLHLGRIADYEVEEAIRKTVSDNGRNADAEGLRLAVEKISGFPFMMQLVGFRAWDANEFSPDITKADFETGVRLASEEMRDRILGATYRELSPEDRRFAFAMLEDEGDSAIADLELRLGRSSSQIAQCRRRLIDAGVIGERSRGVVGFDLPLFREYLLERRG